ncbi:hypothetical protein BKA83DRAFT_4130613 [Pisolithus microcarpus]|nr:hypothetical protein BKA83DRAFT_4130613 [Pisolithus microcarpus]
MWGISTTIGNLQLGSWRCPIVQYKVWSILVLAYGKLNHYGDLSVFNWRFTNSTYTDTPSPHNKDREFPIRHVGELHALGESASPHNRDGESLFWYLGNVHGHGRSPIGESPSPHKRDGKIPLWHSGNHTWGIPNCPFGDSPSPHKRNGEIPFWQLEIPHFPESAIQMNPQNSPWKWSIYPGESPKLTLAVVYFILGNPPTHSCERSIWPGESPNIAQFRPLYMLEKVPLGPQTPPTLMVTIGYPWENGLSPLWHVSFWRISKPVCPSGMWEYPRS